MNEDYNYFQGKDFRKSLAAYEHMVATGEPAEFDSETLTDIAEYYAMNQRMDDADRCIQYALSFYPDSVDPQIFLSRQQMFLAIVPRLGASATQLLTRTIAKSSS